jgi:hypothetical protein
MGYPFNTDTPSGGLGGLTTRGNDVENFDTTIGADPKFAAPTGTVSPTKPTAGGYNQFAVDSFVNKFLKVGLVTPSNFLVKFTPPDGIFKGSESNKSKNYGEVAYLCGAAQLPGMRVATTSLRRHNYGNITKMPYDAMFDDIELTFYVDAAEARSLDLFHQWIRATIDFGKDFGQGSGKKTSLISYRSDYVCPELKIYVVSQLAGLENPEPFPQENGSNGDQESPSPTGPDASPPSQQNTGKYSIVECTLYDVFPISISNILLDWGEADNFARVTVTFSYRVHEFTFGKFTQSSGNKYSYSPAWSSTINGINKEAAEQADFLTSLTQFLGKVADTKRQVQQFKTNWKTFKNADGIGKLTALGNLSGPGSSLNTTANQLNQIVSLTNFITGNGVSKTRSGTKKVINTLP